MSDDTGQSAVPNAARFRECAESMAYGLGAVLWLRDDGRIRIVPDTDEVARWERIEPARGGAPSGEAHGNSSDAKSVAASP